MNIHTKKPDHFFNALIDADRRVEEAARTEERAAELEYEVRHDPLTGLLNRRGLAERAEELREQLDVMAADEPEGNRAKPSNLAIIMFDLDGFKALNDTHGHATGDEALKMFAYVLEGSLRDGQDAAARFGGDEFAAVLSIREPDGITAEDIKEALREKIEGSLETVREYLREHGEDDRHVSGIGVSIGITIYDNKPSSAFDLDQLLGEADEQMYADKQRRKAER